MSGKVYELLVGEIEADLSHAGDPDEAVSVFEGVYHLVLVDSPSTSSGLPSRFEKQVQLPLLTRLSSTININLQLEERNIKG